MAETRDFYGAYAEFKNYAPARLRAKHRRDFDRQVWGPAGCLAEMAFLEVGSGTGLFLAYLESKGVADFLGIDQDPALAAHLPAPLGSHFRVADVREFLAGGADGKRFDRIFMFDVLEHFAADDGARVLKGLAGVLNPGGRIVVRVPNMASPWGAQYQFGDLTHRAAYNPSSLRQLALAAGLACTACRPWIEGSPTRRVLDRALHKLLARVLMTSPEIWSANMLAIIEHRAP